MTGFPNDFPLGQKILRLAMNAKGVSRILTLLPLHGGGGDVGALRAECADRAVDGLPRGATKSQGAAVHAWLLECARSAGASFAKE